MRQDTCQATVMVHDDRWGGFINQCEADPDHKGPHYHSMDACTPPARMYWDGNYEEMRLYL